MRALMWKAALAAMAFLGLGDNGAFADRLSQVNPSLRDGGHFASEQVYKYVAAIPEFVYVLADDSQLPFRAGLVEYGAVAYTYQYSEMLDSGWGTGKGFVNFFGRDVHSTRNRFCGIGENVYGAGNWQPFIHEVFISELLNDGLLDKGNDRPKNKFCVYRDIKGSRFPDVFYCDYNTPSAGRPLAIIARKAGLSHTEFQRKPWTLLNYQGFLRSFSSVDGGLGRYPVLFQRVADQSNGPNADAGRGKSQNCHNPLCIRVARREFGPPVPFIRAVIFLGVFCVGGVWLSYRAIGWITKPRHRNQKEYFSDSDADD